ncbi:unnamed protein product [Parnassius apollo]|uniref:(apollo) hypothetical protein n=1 Tax=Parnassius apollo TaxID=110799 RepID=A0A8S3X4W1_PARAO|nr:unnamed protein product [Parnassius apollo]
MAKDPLNELLEFLKPECRIDLKHISLEHLIGVSGTEEGVQVILKNDSLLKSIIDCTDDRVDEIAKNALLLLINITAYEKGATQLLQLKPDTKKSVLDIFVGYVLDPQKNHADAACMILCNITRAEENIEKCIDLILPFLNDLLNVFVNTGFNKKRLKFRLFSTHDK